MEIDRIIQELAQPHGGLLVVREAVEGGVSRSALDRRRRGGLLVRDQPGVLRIASVAQTLALRHRAALLASPSASALSHRAAATSSELVDSYDDVDISVSGTTHPRLSQVCVHRSLDLLPKHIRTVNGMQVTTVERTLADLGDVVAAWGVARALERAVVERRTTIARVAAILDEIGGRGRNGRGALREVLAGWSLVERPPDSVLEARFAGLVRAAGLPSPVYQHNIYDKGVFVARVDAAWPDRRVIAEVDGAHAHATAAQLQHDLRRQNRLVALGFVVLRWTWADVTRDGARVRSELQAALRH